MQNEIHLERNIMIPRWATNELLRQVKNYRVISVIGCRQSGKTTLLLNAPLAQAKFLSLDEKINFDEAKSDPSFFVRHPKSTTLIIDEVQKVPSLIGEIKYQVDRNPEKGQFIISGSADYRKLPQANESLAGRASFVRVRTLCEAEQRKMPPGFLEALFKGLLPLSLDFECNKELVLSAAIRGGYPELITQQDIHSRSGWFSSYVDNQVLLDMREQWDTRKLNVSKSVLESAAILSSRELNKKALATQSGIAWKTLDTYWSAITSMYLVDMVDGWAKKITTGPGNHRNPL